jgi:hypothetical protein
MYTEESKPVRVVWALVLGLGVLLSNAEAAVYSGGTGTEKDPYQLGSAADWMTLYGTTEDWDKHFVLTGDIDFVDEPVPQSFFSKRFLLGMARRSCGSFPSANFRTSINTQTPPLMLDIWAQPGGRWGLILL